MRPPEPRLTQRKKSVEAYVEQRSPGSRWGHTLGGARPVPEAHRGPPRPSEAHRGTARPSAVQRAPPADPRNRGARAPVLLRTSSRSRRRYWNYWRGLLELRGMTSPPPQEAGPPCIHNINHESTNIKVPSTSVEPCIVSLPGASSACQIIPPARSCPRSYPRSFPCVRNTSVWSPIGLRYVYKQTFRAP